MYGLRSATGWLDLDFPQAGPMDDGGATVQVTDPGRALITGKWADIGKFKGPILRGLAGRAPYFHNGSAATLEDAYVSLVTAE